MTQRTATNRYQEHHGLPRESTAAKVRDHMHPWVQDFIRHAPFCVLSSADGEGNCDASPKGGRPGFVKVIDDRDTLIAGRTIEQLGIGFDRAVHGDRIAFHVEFNDGGDALFVATMVPEPSVLLLGGIAVAVLCTRRT